MSEIENEEPQLPPVDEPVEPAPEPVPYLLMRGDLVDTVCLWDGVTEFTPPEGMTIEPMPEEPVGPGWTREGEVWSPPAPAASIGPIRVTKPDMQRLLTAAQRSRLAKHRKIIAALPPEAYEPGSSEEPNSEYAPWLIALEDVLMAFDLPAEFIELDHPDTVAAIELFRLLDIVESDGEAARILAGEFPT